MCLYRIGREGLWQIYLFNKTRVLARRPIHIHLGTFGVPDRFIIKHERDKIEQKKMEKQEKEEEIIADMDETGTDMLSTTKETT